MCGIVGVVTPAREQIAPGFLERAVDAMIRRGPDDRGVEHLTDVATGAGVLLGQRRLSILDVSAAGHQPMSSPDRQVAAVYNGEVYNFQDIRADLEQHGHTFRSNCDTEVLIAAYQQWGPGFIHKCNGMFALVLWDARASRLLLYRDRIGIKPLYLGIQGGRFYFASVLSALVEIPGFQREVDQDALLAYTAIGYVPGPYAMFSGIQKLQPGHMAIFDVRNWKLEVRPYWQLANVLSEGKRQASSRRAEDYIEEADALLCDAVRLCLVSDVPLGAFLSGGIDSSSVVALMRKVHANVTRTFSIGFEVEQFNEAPAASAIARHLGTEHQEQIVTWADVRDSIPDVPLFYDEPFSDCSCLPTMLLSRMARQGVTVALSGDGGDEVFFGDYYHYRLAHRWQLRHWMPTAIRRLVGGVLLAVPHHWLRRVGAALRARDYGEYYRLCVCTWDRLSFPRLLSGDVAGAIRRLPDTQTAIRVESLDCGIPHMAPAMDFQSLLPDDFLVKTDRASMGYSLEVRVPLLDHRVVEFAHRLPAEVLFHQEQHKYLLKSVLNRYVPKELWDRPKKGFGVPLAEWFRGELYELLRSQLLDSEGLPFDQFDRGTIERIIAVHKSGARNCWRLLWGLLSLGMWYRKYMGAPTSSRSGLARPALATRASLTEAPAS